MALIYFMVETANGPEPHSCLNPVMRELLKDREMKSYEWCNLNAGDLIRASNWMKHLVYDALILNRYTKGFSALN